MDYFYSVVLILLLTKKFSILVPPLVTVSSFDLHKKGYLQRDAAQVSGPERWPMVSIVLQH